MHPWLRCIVILVIHLSVLIFNKAAILRFVTPFKYIIINLYGVIMLQLKILLRLYQRYKYSLRSIQSKPQEPYKRAGEDVHSFNSLELQ